MNMLRTPAVPQLLAAAAAATALLTGCTGGEIVAADGSALTGYAGPSTVTFSSTTTDSKYTVQTGVTLGEMSFSFDPYGPQSATNGPYIPPGTYTLDIKLCTDATHCQPYGHWEHFDLAYDQTCADPYTNKSVQCAKFKIVRCNWPADYNTYGAALCTGSSTSNGVTTLGVLDGP